MALIALLQPDSRYAARLTSALAPAHRIVVCRTWEALHGLIDARRADGCVVDVDLPDRATSLDEIRRLRVRHEHVAIVAQGSFTDPALDVFRLGEMGVDGVLAPEADATMAEVRAVVEQALDSVCAAAVTRALSARVGVELARAVGWSVRQARRHPSVADLAASTGMTPRGLSQRLREAGLPRPRRLLLWGRLLLGGAYLGRDGRSTEEAAFGLGYSTASAFSRALRRETGLTPSDVATGGGLAAVRDALFDRPPGARSRSPGGSVVALLVACAAQAGCAAVGLGGGGGVDRAAIDAVLDAPPVDQVHFGVLAVDARSGRTLYRRNAHRKFVPASNQKILGTAAALALLGPEHRWDTALWTTAPLRDGVLDGDLVLVGTGDPTLSRRYWPSGRAALAALADSAWSAGLRRVSGRLVVDVAAWDSATVGDTWEVADLPWRYASTGGGFAIDEGEVRVVAEGGHRPGGPARASWSPGAQDFVAARLVTAEAGERTRVRAAYLPESRHLQLSGQVAVDAVDTLSFAQRDPVRLAAAELERALAARGIEIGAGRVVAWTPETPLAGACVAGAVPECSSAARLAALASPPLGEVVAGILEPSQNWMTEQLVRTLGAELGEGGSWREGLGVVRDWLTGVVGVDSLDVVPRDGSGLSAYNLVTPRAIVSVLGTMASGPHAEAYRNAMAEPGEEGSTLARRLEGLAGRVFAKTGTISNVNSLSGYLVGDEGGTIHFSILSNGSGLPAAVVRQAIDDVVRILAGQRP